MTKMTKKTKKTKKTLLLALSCLSFFVAVSQVEQPRDVNMLDFGQLETDASAIYLLNDGHTEVRYDRRISAWVASTERIYRIKILKKDALDLGNVKIRLHLAGKMGDQREYVDEIKAYTYNFNIATSRIDKSTLSRKDIFKTNLNEKTKEVSFTLPNVKVNSVLEIRYTKHSPFIDQLDDWDFQKDFPVKRSHFSVTIPAFFVYVFQLQGYLETKDSKMELDREMKPFGRYSYQDLKAYWLMEDIPAFREEPFMTTRDDYLSKLVFQIQTLRTPEYERSYLKTWKDVTQDLQNSHRFKLFYTGKKDFTAFPISQSSDPLARAMDIYQMFKKTFDWDQYYGVYPNVGFRKMMEARKGNASSMGLTLFQILEQAGLDARPVLLSPRFNGAINYNYPFRDKLIATVVWLRIDGTSYLLDPLTDMPFGYLSSEFLNGKGLVLGEQVQWVDLTKGARDMKKSLVNLRVAGDSIQADLELTLMDYGLVDYKDQPEQLFKLDWEPKILSLDEEQVTSRKISARIEKEIEDDLILIPLAFDELLFSETPFQTNDRLYPVDFYYKKRYSYQLNIRFCKKCSGLLFLTIEMTQSMIRKSMIFSWTLIKVYASLAQLEAPKPISKEDFEVDAPGESAIYLKNEGATEIRYYHNGGVFIATTTKLVRIKVLKSAGLELGDFKIPLYVGGSSVKKEERIRDIKAATYNLNEESGQIEVSLLDKKQIRRTEVRKNVEEVSFALPNVQVNAIIQVSYVIESPFITRLDDWYFQKDYPVKESKYSFTVIGPYRYVYALQGIKQLNNAKTNGNQELSPLGRLRSFNEEWWSAEDIPAYKNEPFASTREDNIAKLSIQLESTPNQTFLKSWQDVSKDLLESKRFKQFYIGNKDFSSFVSQGDNSYLNAKNAYQEFKRRFQWDGNLGVYPNVTFRELVKTKRGNTSSMGLALYQVLKQSGFDVGVVLLSPRSNGKINYNYPFVDRLIATAVRLTIDDRTYLLDPVNDVPFGYLHGSFLNGKGLVLGQEVEWQDLTLGLKDYKTSEVVLNVLEDRVQAELELTMKDYGVVSMKNPERLFKSDWEVSDVIIQDNEITEQRISAKINKQIEDDLIPIPLSFDQIVFTKNPFNDNERLYPVEMLCSKQYSYKLEVNLSGEYVFDAIPESKIVKTADGQLSAILNVNQIGKKLNLTFLFWTKTNTFDKAYYTYLKSAYQLMAELSEGAVFVRRKS